MQGSLPPRSVVDGRYRIQSVLAIDPASETYLTTFEPAPMLRYVLKVVRPDQDDIQYAATLLKAEADGLSRVRSDHVARMRGFGRADTERFYLVREFHDGPSLSVVADGIRDAGRTHIERVLQGLSSALRDVHAEGLCLGTLSPEHVVIVDDESGFSQRSVKLLSAGCRRGGSPFELTFLPRHARPYTAPEVLSSRKSSEAGDIYSVAAVMWFVATGEEFDLQTLDEGRGELAQAISPVVRKACSERPDDRHVSIRELGIAFRDRLALLDSARPTRGFQTSNPVRATEHRDVTIDAEDTNVRVFANRRGLENSASWPAAIDTSLPIGVDAPLEPSAVNTGDYPAWTPNKDTVTRSATTESVRVDAVADRAEHLDSALDGVDGATSRSERNRSARNNTGLQPDIAEATSNMNESNRLSGSKVVTIFLIFSALFAAVVMLMAKWMQMN